MIKEFIGTGKTVAEATAAAKTGLNAPALADINVEVIVMPKGKILGIFGGRDAQVKAWYDDGKKEKKPQQKKDFRSDDSRSTAPKKPQPKKEAVKKENAAKFTSPKADKPEPEKPRTAGNSQLGDAEVSDAVRYLKNILKGFSMEDTQITGEVSDGVLRIQIECEDHGIIIGRRGETLDALQYLTGLAVKKGCDDKYVKVSINVGNYRERRTESLSNIARKNAAYVLKTGRRYTFDPMNPYERRIIHTTIQEVEGVESISVGSGDSRRVMLQATDGPRPRRTGGAPRAAQSRPAVKNAAPKSDRADLPKFGKIEVKKD